MKIVSFFAAADIVVIGTDPEMADYDNRRGEIHGSAAFVYAEDERGNRRRLLVKTARFESDALPQAESMAIALTARLAAGKLPVAFDSWAHARPCYGSDAYIEYGQADDLALEREEEFA
jgi:hypothetical protein